MEQRSASDTISFLYPENVAITENQKLFPVNQQEILYNICWQLGYPPYFDRFTYWYSVIVVGLGGLFWTILGLFVLEVLLSGAIRMLNSATDILWVPPLLLGIVAAAFGLYSGFNYFRWLLQFLKPYRQIILKRYEELLLKGNLTSGQIVSVQPPLIPKFKHSVFQYRGRYTINFEYGEHTINTNYLTWQNVEKGQHVHVLHHEGLSVLL